MTVSATSSHPARHKTAIVFASDGLYARFALLAARQITALSPDRSFDICLCSISDPDPVPEALQSLDVRLCKIETGDLFDTLRLDRGRTQVVYLRLALPQAFAQEYDRILYLDSDILVESGDFAALLSADMGDHAVAAVRDNTQWRTPSRRAVQFRRLGLPAAPYFNAGVMMIDVARWNARGVTAQAVDIGTRHRDKMIRHDQNLLNSVFQGDWAEMNPVWNWQYTRASNFYVAMADVNILHFISPTKPWKHNGGRFPIRFRRTYAAFLKSYFPEDRQIEDLGTPPHGNLPYLRKSLWKHLIASRRFVRYLSHFPDQTTLLDPASRQPLI